jgi:Rho-binding antiterminator
MDRGSGYEPIACDFHDRLEALATLRRRVRLSLAAGDGEGLIEGRIEDIYTTESKEEFIRMDDGSAIRLDRIVSVDEAP